VCHVLIIEDEILVALHIQDVVKENGATSVSIATTEAEAVTAASARAPALITSDVSLKTGSGPVAVRAIQARHGSIPVIFITATPDACRSALPNVRVFGKPVDEAAIARAVRQLLAA